jgi:hypothetical protein
MGYGVDIDKAWFQKNGARPHTASNVLEFFKEAFGNRVLSLRTVFPIRTEILSAKIIRFAQNASMYD